MRYYKNVVRLHTVTNVSVKNYQTYNNVPDGYIRYMPTQQETVSKTSPVKRRQNSPQIHLKV